jgi:hypothetical protein
MVFIEPQIGIYINRKIVFINRKSVFINRKSVFLQLVTYSNTASYKALYLQSISLIVLLCSYLNNTPA